VTTQWRVREWRAVSRRPSPGAVRANLAAGAARQSPVIAGALPCSSQRVLRDLVDGRAHVAGVHLRDQKSGEYNLAPIRRAMGSRRSPVVNFARLEIELTMVPGHPAVIHGFAELASAYDTTEIGQVTHT
jgi:molybdate-binding protein